MATLITPVAGSATPYSKKFVLEGDGAAGLFSIDDFMTHLDEGPLKETLRRTPTLNVGQFDIDQARGDEIRIYLLAHSPTDAAYYPPGSRNIHWVSAATTALAGLSCTVSDEGETNAPVVIEVRLNHTTQG